MDAKLHWSKLECYARGDENPCGRLGEAVVLRRLAESHHPVVGPSGDLAEAHGLFIAAPGEEPDSETPRGPTDWTGFREALAAHLRK